MSADEFSLGDGPAIRRAVVGRYLDGYRCPFCGAERLVLSDMDLPIDTARVEVYCDNKPECEACEIVILIRRGRGTHRRADVSALRAVDRGTEAEQEADGKSDGAWSMRKFGKARSRGEQDRDSLDRRRRATDVTVTPVPAEDEAD